jgi:hypothetical protein
MKRSQLKEIVKECIREVLLEEEGLLSGIISEVTTGIVNAQNILSESTAPHGQSHLLHTETLSAEAEDNKRRKRLLETKRKMLDVIGDSKMSNVFEGTEPLKSSGESQSHSPMAGRDPQDAGVDISNLFSLAGKKWKHLK